MNLIEVTLAGISSNYMVPEFWSLIKFLSGHPVFALNHVRDPRVIHFKAYSLMKGVLGIFLNEGGIWSLGSHVCDMQSRQHVRTGQDYSINEDEEECPVWEFVGSIMLDFAIFLPRGAGTKTRRYTQLITYSLL